MSYYKESWLYREVASVGPPLAKPQERPVYQAPPLDGVWATAPYFHNGSVPTLYHVLNSQARPKLYTRGFRGDVDEFHQTYVGWKWKPLKKMPPNLSGFQRRKIVDTTQPGRGNQGHRFGDALTDPQRMAVIEYLKTL